MSITETTSAPMTTEEHTERSGPSAKIVQLKHALQERTGAMSGWARRRADAARTGVERHPFATAGGAAGAAFVGGLAIGLLLSGRFGLLERRARPWGERLYASLRR